ncbi:MAG: hypothetical protein C7B45_15035, partial [Sulfobacillus acidophilus]
QASSVPNRSCHWINVTVPFLPECPDFPNFSILSSTRGLFPDLTVYVCIDLLNLERMRCKMAYVYVIRLNINIAAASASNQAYHTYHQWTEDMAATAAKAMGRPVEVLYPMTGSHTSVLFVVSYDSMQQIEEAQARMKADPAYQKLVDSARQRQYFTDQIETIFAATHVDG